MKVNQINIEKNMSVSDLVNQFDKSGVLGAGRVGRACNVLTDMINDDDMKVYDTWRHEKHRHTDD